MSQRNDPRRLIASYQRRHRSAALERQRAAREAATRARRIALGGRRDDEEAGEDPRTPQRASPPGREHGPDDRGDRGWESAGEATDVRDGTGGNPGDPSPRSPTARAPLTTPTPTTPVAGPWMPPAPSRGGDSPKGGPPDARHPPSQPSLPQRQAPWPGAPAQQAAAAGAPYPRSPSPLHPPPGHAHAPALPSPPPPPSPLPASAAKAFYASQLMLSEWMLDCPEDLATDWLCLPRPEGTRVLVVSARGSTVARLRTGAVLRRFPSSLPCGGAPGAPSGREAYCILDCIYDRTSDIFWILDVPCWKGAAFFHCTYEFRNWWIGSQLGLDESPRRPPGAPGEAGPGRGEGVPSPPPPGDEAGGLPAPMDTAGSPEEGPRPAASAPPHPPPDLPVAFGAPPRSRSRPAAPRRRQGPPSFVPLPCFPADEAGLLAATGGHPVPFERDGIYLVHREARYVAGASPLSLIWKDSTCARYVVDTDASGRPLAKQVVTLRVLDGGGLATCDDPPVILGRLDDRGRAPSEDVGRPADGGGGGGDGGDGGDGGEVDDCGGRPDGDDDAGRPDDVGRASRGGDGCPAAYPPSAPGTLPASPSAPVPAARRDPRRPRARHPASPGSPPLSPPLPPLARLPLGPGSLVSFSLGPGGVRFDATSGLPVSADLRPQPGGGATRRGRPDALSRILFQHRARTQPGALALPELLAVARAGSGAPGKDKDALDVDPAR